MAINTYTSTMSAWTATDAGFRTWGKAWTDMLDTMGLTQVYSDIDWTTATMPATQQMYAGKRVYRLNDSVSATREVYIAVEFGRGNTTLTAFGFAIRVSVGTTHSSGTVSNYLMQDYLSMTQAPTDGGDIIGVKTDLGFSIWTNLSMGAACQGGFAVERLAENGAATPDGAVLMVSGQGSNGMGSNTTSAVFHTANYAGGAVFTARGGAKGSDVNTFLNPQSISAGVDPSYAGKAPAILMDTFGKHDPCYHWIGVSKYLYSPATQFEATINGVTGTYRTPATGFLLDHGNTTSNLSYLAMLVG